MRYRAAFVQTTSKVSVPPYNTCALSRKPLIYVPPNQCTNSYKGIPRLNENTRQTKRQACLILFTLYNLILVSLLK